jgi:hypothetical protein
VKLFELEGLSESNQIALPTGLFADYKGQWTIYWAFRDAPGYPVSCSLTDGNDSVSLGSYNNTSGEMWWRAEYEGDGFPHIIYRYGGTAGYTKLFSFEKQSDIDVFTNVNSAVLSYSSAKFSSFIIWKR